jgi:dienelactone hydrolase
MIEIEKSVRIPFDETYLEGNLILPKNAQGIVLFAHGSGSSRFSPRNRFVSNFLNERNLATLLIDLLTPEEGQIDDITREFRFDIKLLTDRLILITDWLLKDEQTRLLPIGYFGSSTGAACALEAAAIKGPLISAVVSRGGRPDLALEYLDAVIAPTLLIVGGNDQTVIELNQKALLQLRCEKKLAIIPKATHLFEEPGALEQVAKLAEEWFLMHFMHQKAKNIKV